MLRFFDAIATEIAFRYAWFSEWLRSHTLVEVVFFEELKSDAAPWERLVRFLGICANQSDVRAALGDNSVVRLQQRGYTVARKGEIESFRRELGPDVVAELNRRAARLLQPELVRRWGISRELRLQARREARATNRTAGRVG